MISSSLRRPVKMASNSRLVSAVLSGWPPGPRVRIAGKSTETLVTFMPAPSRRHMREVACDLKEVAEQSVAVLRSDTFGMELHAMHGMVLVHHALDHAVLAGGGDLQRRRHGGRIDGQRMIAGGEEVVVEAAKHRLAGV